jgi:hypothetical protein
MPRAAATFLRVVLVLSAALISSLCLASSALADNCGTSGTFTITANHIVSSSSCVGTVTVPSSVTHIDASAFYGSGITAVTFTAPSSLTTIGTYAFRNTASLTSITLPNSVTSIGNFAFLNATALTSINIPSGVTNFGFSAFDGASSLTKLTIPGGTTISEQVFARMAALQRVEFLGNQPSCNGIMGYCNSIFDGSPNVTVYRFASATGWPAIGTAYFSRPQAYLVLPPATLVAVGGDTSATLTVTAPSAGPTPATYTVEAVGDASKTCTITAPATSCIVTGLTNGTSYTFTAKSNTTSPVAISDTSGASNAVTPQVPAPNAPGTPTAIAGDAQATITVTAGSGGAPVTYLVTTVEDNAKTCTVTAPATSCTITGLTNGTSYTFTVTATNAGGTSSPSNASAAVTPVAPASDGVTALMTSSTGTSTQTRPLPATSTRTRTSIITTFTAPGPGVAHQVGTTPTNRRNPRAATLTVCTFTKTIANAGKTSLTCNLTSAAKRARMTRAIVITLTTTFTPTSGTPMVSTKTIRLPRTASPAAPEQNNNQPSNVTG